MKWTRLFGVANQAALWRCRMALVLLAAMLLVAVCGHAAEVYSGRVTHVSDGDTLWVAPEAGGPPHKLRIDGIDAPEICQAGGEASRAALAARVLRRQVRVELRRHDDYGRGLARVRLGDADLGALMVREGQAWSYRWRHHPGPYAAEEAAARAMRRGLFAAERPEPPRAFRKRHGSCYEEKR